MAATESHRADKWLWEVRLYKTRSQATEACRAGKVKINGESIKPARELRQGDILHISLNPLRKTVEVLQFPTARLGAKWVGSYCADHTPAEEYERVKLIADTQREYRPQGLGRPTKKSRRVIDKLKNSKDQWEGE